MKIRLNTQPRGIALIMVMLVIFVLGMLAGGFAYSMKVELRLAQNHNSETEMEWLGRSGVELARYVLAQQMLIPSEQFDSLNQKWAGGIGVTNEALAEISLDDNELGGGKFSVKIIDNERKFNITAADQTILQQALNMAGIDAASSSPIVDSIMDWIDTDDNARLSGTESEYYLTLDPPYFAKNSAIDDMAELLLIRGLTPELYWGPGASGAGGSKTIAQQASSRIFSQKNQVQGSVGLVDLFTATAGRLINLNTASAAVLELIPGIDENIAQAIIQMRSGPDGVEGNEDDTPFRTVGELVNVPGIGRQMTGAFQRFFTVRSLYFEVHVLTQINTYKREYVALLRRNNARDVQTLYFYWK